MNEAPQYPRESKFRAFVEGALYFLSAFALALLIQTYVARPFIVNGQSMDPTFSDGEYLIVDEISYRFNDPARGDVVVFRAPPTPEKFFIKRIIGLPGETVEIKNGIITIKNDEYPKGFVLKEEFITHRSHDTYHTTVPDGAYFVMGDNRQGSYDSRSWGSLPEENLRGKALVRLLPIKNIDFLPGKVEYSAN